MRVIDAATVYAGPLAATMLGDFGADVIKVEHPDGDSARTHGRSKDGVGLWWKVLGRNKRTVTAKLSTPEGRELFLDLVRTADVLIENFRPGVFERWDLSPELLHEINPGPGHPAGDRVRADRPGRAAPRVRHPDRGDERAGAHDRRPGRPAHAAAVRAGRRHRRAGRRVRHHAGAAAPGARRPRAGDRPVAAGAAADDPRPGTDRVRPARRDPGPARQPLAEQRPAQHLPDPGRPLGGGVGQLAVGRAAGADPGRAPGGHRGALVPLGREAGRARRRAGRLRVGLDRRARRGVS